MTAAGVLGLMAVWRAFYTVFLDFWNVRTFTDQPINRYQVRTHSLHKKSLPPLYLKMYIFIGTFGC